VGGTPPEAPHDGSERGRRKEKEKEQEKEKDRRREVLRGSGSGLPGAQNQYIFCCSSNRNWLDPTPAGQGPEPVVF